MVIDNSVKEHYNEGQYRISMKKIVAYSYLKQIEMESEEFKCNEQYKIDSADSLHDGSEEESKTTRNFEEDTWTHIENTNLYISSVNLDQRFDPYHYIRFIGVVKGKNAI